MLLRPVDDLHPMYGKLIAMYGSGAEASCHPLILVLELYTA